MSYAPNYPDLFRRAADYVDKILHGTKPDEIPVEQPTLKTAKALGLTLPEKCRPLMNDATGIGRPLNDLCLNVYAATFSVLFWGGTMPCPEPWGRQCNGAAKQAANQLKRDAARM
jgi:hypothetical protein